MITTEKAIEMIDEYLLEPNSISKDWIKCMQLCKQAILDSESQKAEIERLQKEGLILNKTFMDFVNNKKSEAIKEFAERLPQYIPHFDGDTRMECVYRAIDHLVKEMVGTKADTSVSLVDGHLENDLDSRVFWEDTH